MLKAKRKVELPPVNEALYLNADLLFALAEEIDISSEEQGRIEAILHENGNEIFLAKTLDNRFWFENKPEYINVDEIEISFDGENLSIPAICVTDRSNIQITISGEKDDTIIEDWAVTKVKRPKKSKNCSEFIVSFESEVANDYKYQAGETVTIKVIPVVDTPDENIIFKYNVTSDKKAFVFDGIKFERDKNG